MEKEKQLQSSVRFITCLSLPIIMLFFTFFSTGLLFFVLFSPYGTDKTVGVIIVCIIMLGILPWGLFIWFALKLWQINELSENGIKKAFLKKFLKNSITWEALLEIRVIAIPTGGAWLFFSKKSLEGMSIGKARTQKGQIYIEYSLKLHKAIRQFTDKEIIGVSDDILNDKK